MGNIWTRDTLLQVLHIEYHVNVLMDFQEAADPEFRDYLQDRAIKETLFFIEQAAVVHVEYRDIVATVIPPSLEEKERANSLAAVPIHQRMHWMPKVHQVRLRSADEHDGKQFEFLDAPRPFVVPNSPTGSPWRQVNVTTLMEAELGPRTVLFRLAGWHEQDRTWLYSPSAKVHPSV